MKKELESLRDMGVMDELTNHEVVDRYWSKGIKTVTVPGLLVATKNHSMMVQEGGKQGQNL